MNETWWVGPDQLNEEQRAVIALPLDGSHLIVGPPGSGKTNLLLLRANYMTLAGQANIMVIVFTRTLNEFIVSGATQYAFPASKVQTCRRWEHDFLREYGVNPDPPDDFEKQRIYFIQQLQTLIRKRKLTQVYDGILLDEAQDYVPEEIKIFKRLSKVLFAVVDDRQKIYKVTDCMDTLKKVVDKYHPLRYHYRIASVVT